MRHATNAERTFTVTPQPSSSSLHVYGLDILRFFAALLVAMLHLWSDNAVGAGSFGDYYIGRITGDLSPFRGQLLPPVVFTGSLGVQIFFAISGFVISYSASKSKTTAGFLYRRALRLLPALWICTLVSFCIAVFTGFYGLTDGLLRLVRSLLITPIGSHVDDVVWTLVLEIVFYLYVAFLIAVGRLTLLFHLGVVLTLVSLFYWGSYFLGGCHVGVPSTALVCSIIGNRFVEKFTTIALIQHGCFFAVGIFMWLALSQRRRVAIYFAFVPAILTCVLQVVWTSQYFASTARIWGASQAPYLELFVWSTAMMFFVFACYARHFVMKLIGGHMGLVRLIGLSTYPLYLTHSFVGNYFLALSVKAGLNAAAPFIGVLAAVLCSMAIAHHLEPNLRRAIERLTTRLARVWRFGQLARRVA